MKRVRVRSIEVVEDSTEGRKLFEVLVDQQLGSLGHVKRGAIVELLEGATNSRHLKPLGDFEQTGDPDERAVFQLIEEAI